MVKIIVACDENYGIGFQGKIPWHVSEDLNHFKELTLGSVVIMGRKTFESLSNPLNNRMNICLTQHLPNVVLARNNVYYFGNINASIEYCKSFLMNYSKIIYIIGGAQIYSLALKENLVEEVIMTRHYGTYECDSFFPIDLIKNWKIEKKKKGNLDLEIYYP